MIENETNRLVSPPSLHPSPPPSSLPPPSSPPSFLPLPSLSTREINKPTEKSERKYIVFDGDVDTLWVESMNSVMDDNRLLTLANGERIRLQKHCALLVEVIGTQV